MQSEGIADRLVSVVIPAYNVADYFRECMQSLLAQSYACWEAIIVDDGSTDDTASLSDEYARTDSRIRVIHREHAVVGV